MQRCLDNILPKLKATGPGRRPYIGLFMRDIPHPARSFKAAMKTSTPNTKMGASESDSIIQNPVKAKAWQAPGKAKAVSTERNEFFLGLDDSESEEEGGAPKAAPKAKLVFIL